MSGRLVAINEAGDLIGESHPRAKLSDAAVLQLLDLRAQGWSLGQLARLFSMSKNGVASICSGRNRTQKAVAYTRPRPRRQRRAAEPPCRAPLVLDIDGMVPSYQPSATAKSAIGDDDTVAWPKPVPDPIPPLPPREAGQEPGARVVELIVWVMAGAVGAAPAQAE